MARPTNHQRRYRYVGRTSKMTEEVVSKLEECAALRASVQESCFYAGISRDTYYRWMKENPQLSDRLDDLRQKPFIKARQTIISHLDDVNVAFKFMEKSNPEEFADTLKMQHSGQIATGEDEYPEDQAIRLELKKRLFENIQKRARDKETPKT